MRGGHAGWFEKTPFPSVLKSDWNTWKMSTIDFDDVLVHVGEKGRYQNIMYYLLCIPATLPAAFLAFSQVRLSIISLALSLHIVFFFVFVFQRSSHPSLLYLETEGQVDSQVFVSASPEHWCRIPELENSNLTVDQRKALSLPYTPKSDGRRSYSRCYMYDVNYTAIIEAWLHQEAASNSSRTSIANGAAPGLPPVGSTDWPISKCQHGWIYDRKDYDSTLVTEVNSPLALLL